MDSLEQLLTCRHSVRRFLPTPVPKHIVEEALAAAQLSPSNSNTQPWRLFLVSGAAKDRVSAALLKEATGNKKPLVSPLPDSLMHHRFDMGSKVYAAMGVTRADKEARRAARLRNYEFFGAPLAGFICMHRDLGLADAAGVGMWFQTLMLALAAKGVGTCAQVALALFPEVVRRELPEIGEDLVIISGLSIGYEDESFSANRVRVGRDPHQNNVTYITD